jgi:hypothetical protein
MAQDVITAGGTPILVTSLSRRKYSSGVIIKDLVDQVAATLAVAASIDSAFIDLNKASMAYLNAIGETNARLYDRAEGDATHLNPAGGLVFGNMVSSLIECSKVRAAVAPYLTQNATIVNDIKSGTFILPSV